jgi:hypothetical protein
MARLKQRPVYVGKLHPSFYDEYKNLYPTYPTAVRSEYEEYQFNEELDHVRPPKQEYPVTMKDWFLTIILSVLPVIGVVFSLVFGLTPKYRPSKKNFGRAMLIVHAVAMACFAGIILGLIFGMGVDVKSFLPKIIYDKF